MGKSATFCQLNMKSTEATSEQLRIAKLINENSDDNEAIKNKIQKVKELIKCADEDALIALHDSDNDVNKAVDKLLEGSADTDSWCVQESRKPRKQQIANQGCTGSGRRFSRENRDGSSQKSNEELNQGGTFDRNGSRPNRGIAQPSKNVDAPPRFRGKSDGANRFQGRGGGRRPNQEDGYANYTRDHDADSGRQRNRLECDRGGGRGGRGRGVGRREAGGGGSSERGGFGGGKIGTWHSAAAETNTWNASDNWVPPSEKGGSSNTWESNMWDNSMAENIPPKGAPPQPIDEQSRRPGEWASGGGTKPSNASDEWEPSDEWNGKKSLVFTNSAKPLPGSDQTPAAPPPPHLSSPRENVHTDSSSSGGRPQPAPHTDNLIRADQSSITLSATGSANGPPATFMQRSVDASYPGKPGVNQDGYTNGSASWAQQATTCLKDQLGIGKHSPPDRVIPCSEHSKVSHTQSTRTPVEMPGATATHGSSMDLQFGNFEPGVTIDSVPFSESFPPSTTLTTLPSADRQFYQRYAGSEDPAAMARPDTLLTTHHHDPTRNFGAHTLSQGSNISVLVPAEQNGLPDSMAVYSGNSSAVLNTPNKEAFSVAGPTGSSRNSSHLGTPNQNLQNGTTVESSGLIRGHNRNMSAGGVNYNMVPSSVPHRNTALENSVDSMGSSQSYVPGGKHSSVESQQTFESSVSGSATVTVNHGSNVSTEPTSLSLSVGVIPNRSSFSSVSSNSMSRPGVGVSSVNSSIGAMGSIYTAANGYPAGFSPAAAAMPGIQYHQPHYFHHGVQNYHPGAAAAAAANLYTPENLANFIQQQQQQQQFWQSAGMLEVNPVMAAALTPGRDSSASYSSGEMKLSLTDVSTTTTVSSSATNLSGASGGTLSGATATAGSGNSGMANAPPPGLTPSVSNAQAAQAYMTGLNGFGYVTNPYMVPLQVGGPPPFMMQQHGASAGQPTALQSSGQFQKNQGPVAFPAAVYGAAAGYDELSSQDYGKAGAGSAYGMNLSQSMLGGKGATALAGLANADISGAKSFTGNINKALAAQVSTGTPPPFANLAGFASFQTSGGSAIIPTHGATPYGFAPPQAMMPSPAGGLPTIPLTADLLAGNPGVSTGQQKTSVHGNTSGVPRGNASSGAIPSSASKSNAGGANAGNFYGSSGGWTN